jgi:hypothetical protein
MGKEIMQLSCDYHDTTLDSSDLQELSNLMLSNECIKMVLGIPSVN